MTVEIVVIATNTQNLSTLTVQPALLAITVPSFWTKLEFLSSRESKKRVYPSLDIELSRVSFAS